MTQMVPAWREQVEKVMKELERELRAGHQYAATADHPASARRIDRDVKATMEPIQELFDGLLHDLTFYKGE